MSTPASLVVVPDDPDAIRVVALVDAGWKLPGLVLNRPLRFRYEEIKGSNSLIGRDGPFADVLLYERGGGSFKAFAGREFTLTMADGTERKVKDHWWQGSLKGHLEVATGTVEGLVKCFVFGGGSCIKPDDLAALLEGYKGVTYPIRDYEKIIRYEPERRQLLARMYREERKAQAAIKEAKRQHRLLNEALARVPT